MPLNRLAEHDRYAYLEQMGVTMHYRRQQVALSAASFLNFDEALPEASSQIPPVLLDHVLEQTSGPLLAPSEADLPLENQDASVTDEKSGVASEDTHLPLNDRPSLNFQSYLVDATLFVDLQPQQISDENAHLNRRLLRNMCLAMRFDAVDVLAEDTMNWPQFSNAKVRQSSYDASVYLAQRLAMICALNKVDKIVLLGELTHQLCAPEGIEFMCAFEFLSMPAVSVPSLSQMIHIPALKADAWQALKEF